MESKVITDTLILRQKSERVVKIDNALVTRMFNQMYLSKGIGLAAIQLGIPLQIFVMDVNGPMVVINPTIISRSEDMVLSREGCLSIPGHLIDVPRHKSIKVRFRGLDNKYRAYDLSGLEAICFQHEYDHLQGKLITDYLRS